MIMLKRLLKVLIAIVLSLMFTVSLVKIVLLIWSSYPDWLHPHSIHEPPSSFTADEWLAYQHLLRDKGKLEIKPHNIAYICMYAMQYAFMYTNLCIHACKICMYLALCCTLQVCVCTCASKAFVKGTRVNYQ